MAYKVQGSVKNGNLGIENVEINVIAETPVYTDANGHYEKELGLGQKTITPSKTGYTFDPVNQSVDVSGDIVYPRFTVGGTAAYVYKVLELADGTFLVGGSFTSINGLAIPYLAHLYSDFTVDATFNMVNGWVKDIEQQSTGKIIISGNFSQVGGETHNRIARLNSNLTIDSAFTTSANGNIDRVWLTSNDFIIVAGPFSLINAKATTHFGILTADGFNTFIPGFTFNNTVLAVAVDPLDDNIIYVGGSFTNYNGSGSNYAIKLYTYGHDLTWACNPQGSVYALFAQADGKVVLGGGFSYINATPKSRIGRVNANGSVDTSFTTSANSIVSYIIEVENSYYLIAGVFESVDTEARYRIAKIDSADGSIDLNFDPPSLLNGDKYTGVLYGAPIMTQDGHYLFPGILLNNFGQRISPVIYLNNTDGTVNEGVSFQGAVNQYTLTYQAGSNGSILGTSPQTVNYGSNGTAVSAIPDPNYAFSQWNDGSTANPRTDLNVTANITVQAVFVATLTDYTVEGNVGFEDVTVTASPGGFVTSSNAQGNFSLDVAAGLRTFTPAKTGLTFTPASRTITVAENIIRWTHTFNGDVYAIVRWSNYYLVGGAFSQVDGQTRRGLALFDLDYNLRSEIFDTNIGGVVHALYVSLDNPSFAYIGGSFTSLVGGSACTNFGKISIGVSLATNYNVNNTVRAITGGSLYRISGGQYENSVIIGGLFTLVGGVTANRLYCFKEVDNTSRTIPPVLGGDVYTLAFVNNLNADILLVGGNFTTLSGSTRNNLGKLKWNTLGVGTWDLSAVLWNTNGEVYDIQTSTTFAYVGGNFTTLSSTIRQYIGKINALTDTGTGIPESFNPAPNSTVRSITLFDTCMIVGGNFTVIAGQQHAYLAGFTNDYLGNEVLNPDCFLTLNGAVHFVQALSPKVFIDGSYTTVDGEANTNPIVAYPPGLLDMSFEAAVDQFSLIYTPGANGSLIGAISQVVNYGTDGTPVEAVPDPGYMFSYWSDSRTDNPRTDVNVTSNVTVTAVFTIETFTLTYISGTNGAIDGNTIQVLEYGQEGSEVIAIPNAGFDFINWSDGRLLTSRKDIVTEEVTYTAHFGNFYILQYTAGLGGEISGEPYQLVLGGEDGTEVEAVADEYSSFIGWSDGVQTAIRQDLNVATDITVEALFNTAGKLKINSNIVSAFYINDTEFACSTESVPVAHLVAPGEYTLTFKVIEGYAQPEPKTIIVTAGTLQECEVYYDPESISYTIRGNVGRQGVSIGSVLSDIDGNYEVSVFHGANISLTPELTGYYFCPRVRHFTDVQSNFEDQDYLIFEGEEPPMVTLTLVTTEGGSVAGGGDYLIDSEAQISAIAHPGYAFVRWSDNNTEASRTITVIGDITLTAYFERETYTITTSVTGNGTALPATQEVVYQGVATIEAIPAVGYVFQGWFINGVRQSTRKIYTFEVTGDADLVAQFIVSVPTLPKEVVGLMTAELGVDSVATIGESLLIGVERVSDTDAIPLDQEYLCIRRNDDEEDPYNGLFQIALQKGTLADPTDRIVYLTFDDDALILDVVKGESLDFTAGEFDTLSALTSFNTPDATITDLAVTNKAEIKDLDVTGTLNLFKGSDHYIDNIFATGYLNVGQGSEYKLRAGGIRYTGAVRAEIIEVNGNEVVLDQSFADIVGKILIKRGGSTEYTIVSGAGDTYILNTTVSLGEIIIYTEGDWEGWNGDQWVSFSAIPITPQAVSTGTTEQRVTQLEAILIALGFATA